MTTVSTIRKTPELRAMLARLKTSYNDTLGHISATVGADSRYRTSLNVSISGSNAVLTISGSTAFMGSDGPGGSVPDPEKVVDTVPANAPSIVKAIKQAISEDGTLSRYAKLKDFQWSLAGSRLDLRGVNAENAQKALDWRVMDWDMWELKWTKPAAPAPLNVSTHMHLSDLAAQLKRHGVSIGDDYVKLGSRDGYVIADLPPKKAMDLLGKSFPIFKKRSWGFSYYLTYEDEQDEAGFHLFQTELRLPTRKIWLLRNHW